MLGLRRKDEPGVTCVPPVLIVVVVIDPGSQPVPEVTDEGQGYLVEPTRLGTGEGDVEDDDPPLE